MIGAIIFVGLGSGDLQSWAVNNEEYEVSLENGDIIFQDEKQRNKIFKSSSSSSSSSENNQELTKLTHDQSSPLTEENGDMKHVSSTC